MVSISALRREVFAEIAAEFVSAGIGLGIIAVEQGSPSGIIDAEGNQNGILAGAKNPRVQLDSFKF
ncbi:MAG: hypothetical protein K6T90_02990 [Leptolyngbyaceae cyanobacterium HOT.MB2.61]|jgi:hypothetical protein|nr:hypothetical protein [Leptolyngbyaceae cyanobacterium HOT.MB2.61]